MKPRVSGQRVRPQDHRHGHPRESVGHALGACFGFGQADVGQLGIGEQAVRDEPAARRPAAAVRLSRTMRTIVLADVRELRAAGAFARRPDVRGRCLQSLVDADVAARIQFDASLRPRPVGRCSAFGRPPPGCRRLRASLCVAPERTSNGDAVPRTSRDALTPRLAARLRPLILHQLQRPAETSRRLLPRADADRAGRS